ncbi:YbbR family protein [Anaerovibrio sp. JC8]|nr:YbbR family protein [Anaerovibrio sp. JC8]
MNRIQNLFRRNLPAKILAILGAVVLWFFVMNEQNPAVNSTFTVPVGIVNEPANHKVTLSTHEVNIEVRAPRASFTSAKAEDFKAYVDLSEAVDGTNNVKVRTVVPQGFEVVDVSSDVIEVTMEAIIDKVVPVDIQVTGNTGAHSALEKVTPAKGHVRVSGTRSSVDRVNRIVGYINLANNTADFANKVKLTPVDSAGNMVESVSLDFSEMTVTVKIMSGVDKKLVPIKPVYSGKPGYKLIVGDTTTQPDKVEITGKTELLEKINDIATETIDVSGATEDIVKDVNLVLPDGIISPSRKVTVKIFFKKVN